MTIMQTSARFMAMLLACAAAQSASASCYHIYTTDGTLIYRSITAPVDLSAHLHESLSEIEGGASMVFTTDSFDCAGAEINDIEGRKRPNASSEKQPSKERK